MLSTDAVLEHLAAQGLSPWQAPIRQLLAGKLRAGVHGQLPEWDELLRQLPDIETVERTIDAATVSVAADCDSQSKALLRELLLKLIPWRKGPFHVCGVDIDSEWRSDMKWSRVAKSMSSLCDRRVLDVGCGNGYYALRMRGQGARFVLGLEPTLLYLVQFLAVQRYLQEPAVCILPLRLAELPAGSHAFDTSFSMGVLYHQRDPLEHLRQLRGTLRDGGELVLETLVLPGDECSALTPPDRYARMRNVWSLPTSSQLLGWLGQCGFAARDVADVSVTRTDEQRSSEWMPFESLQAALDPANPELTVEGLPRPRRAIVIARAMT